MKNLVTGGAGFIGSNLIEELLSKKEEVLCIDNLSTGKKINIEKWFSNKNFQLISHDITRPIDIRVDKVWHLACPASPKNYKKDPIQTSKTNFLGTLNALEIAKKNKAPMIFTSSSEIYGNSDSYPQSENYFGNVNPISKKSCYKEGKRIAETLCIDYLREHLVDVKIARIFNIYGSKMDPEDGRVVTSFICNGIQGKQIKIYGDGEQTRSFCHINDLLKALFELMKSGINGPINLGNPYEEITINNLAKLINKKLKSNSPIIRLPADKDEPRKRKPCINLAKDFLNWEPKITLEKGLDDTISFFRKII